MKIKILLTGWILAFLPCFIYAQKWVEGMQDPKGNFYKVQEDFQKYWSTRDITEKGKGYKAFKRWENFVERRVYPSGDLSLLGQNQKNFEEFLALEKAKNPVKGAGNNNNMIASATWTAIGPMGPMSGSAGSQLLKSGRINFITIHPAGSNTLWVGAPAGGLWQSTNGGASWTTNTDYLGVVGCSDLAVDPTNTSILYLATGDGDAGDTRSIGVLKSTNGGQTWAATGLTNNVTNNFVIRRLIIDPSNPQILLAATNNGIYRTANGGTSWTIVANGSYYDLEFKPGDPNTIYAAANVFRISTNNGTSFTTISSGIPTTGANRMAIAVTPHDANYVYVLASSSSNSGMLGFYRSTASGTVFTQMTTTLNLLGYNSNGGDTGGQGWYDLCIAANPLNKDEVVTGGVNVWRTTNGGGSWSIYGHWTGSGAPFTHADQHDLEFDAAGVLFNCNDGTVYKRNGTAWQEISGTMNISQIYRIGMSSITSNKWITGHQDNGTSIWNGTTYAAKLGGDGMDCFYDYTTDNNVFGSYQNGSLMRSTNGGTSWSSVTSGLTGTAPWLTPWKQAPGNSNTLYCGYSNLFVSNNQGTSWSQLTALPTGGTINEFAIAPSNNQIIYVLKSGGIFKTLNAGTTWTNVTGTVPVGSGSPQYICIDPTDPNQAWVVLSGYSAGNKVFMTTNGGTSWTNYSANLPNLPANCIVYQPGSNDVVYVGMDVGIYYRVGGASSWSLYNAGLPNVPISELEISPASPNLIHAATFGRGVWVASVFSSATLPVSNYSVTSANICAGAPITFSDQSINSPNAWSWTVTPSTGVTVSSYTVPSPVITFPNGGNYTISLQSSNSNGAGNVYSQSYMILFNPTISVTSKTVCAGSPATFTATGAQSYTWSNGGGNSSIATFTPMSTTVYTVSGSSSGCSSTKTVMASTAGSPSMTISGANSICIGNNLTLLAGGAASYTWNTGTIAPFITVAPNSTTSYTVNGTSSAGCKGSAIKTVVVNPLPVVTINSSDSVICIDMSVQLDANGAVSYTWLPGGQSPAVFSDNPTTTTTYTLIGTDANGCTNSTVKTVTVLLCEEIKNSTGTDNRFTIFPNPTKGKLIVQSKSPASHILIRITDVSGKTVYSHETNFDASKTAEEINISQLAAGTYFVKLVIEGKNTEPVRILKE
jgi:photosystem II stability/assembly factor-like uncharacterized protein